MARKIELEQRDFTIEVRVQDTNKLVHKLRSSGLFTLTGNSEEGYYVKLRRKSRENPWGLGKHGVNEMFPVDDLPGALPNLLPVAYIKGNMLRLTDMPFHTTITADQYDAPPANRRNYLIFEQRRIFEMTQR